MKLKYITIAIVLLAAVGISVGIYLLINSIKEEPGSCWLRDCSSLDVSKCEKIEALNCEIGKNLCLTKYCENAGTENECKEMGKRCLWKENTCKDNFDLRGCLDTYKTKNDCEADAQGLGCLWVVDNAGTRCMNDFQFCDAFDKKTCAQQKNCFWYTRENSCVQKKVEGYDELKKIEEKKTALGKICQQITKRKDCRANDYCMWRKQDSF